MGSNPLDSYQDVFPWRWHWSRDIKPHAISKLTAVKALYDNLDFWTYENHLKLHSLSTTYHKGNFVDIYWSDDGEERLQLPPPIGDHVYAILKATQIASIQHMVWFGKEVSYRFAERPYGGRSGQMVDHIHVEFRHQ